MQRWLELAGVALSGWRLLLLRRRQTFGTGWWRLILRGLSR